MHKVKRTLATIFGRTRASRTSEQSTDYEALEDAAGGLAAEYRRLVTEHLRRWGVPEKCAHVDVRGDGQPTRETFVVTITVLAWDREPVLRLMLGLPLLEKRIRKSLEGQWIGDMSRFDGLLLKMSPSLQARQPAQELRQLLVSLTGTPASSRHPPDRAVLRH